MLPTVYAAHAPAAIGREVHDRFRELKHRRRHRLRQFQQRRRRSSSITSSEPIPSNIAKTATCKDLILSAIDFAIFSGNTFSRNASIPDRRIPAVASVAYCRRRAARSTTALLPPRDKLIATTPISSASVVTTSKYTSVFTPMRPSLPQLPMSGNARQPACPGSAAPQSRASAAEKYLLKTCSGRRAAAHPPPVPPQPASRQKVHAVSERRAHTASSTTPITAAPPPPTPHGQHRPAHTSTGHHCRRALHRRISMQLTFLSSPAPSSAMKSVPHPSAAKVGFDDRAISLYPEVMPQISHLECSRCHTSISPTLRKPSVRNAPERSTSATTSPPHKAPPSATASGPSNTAPVAGMWRYRAVLPRRSCHSRRRLDAHAAQPPQPQRLSQRRRRQPHRHLQSTRPRACHHHGSSLRHHEDRRALRRKCGRRARSLCRSRHRGTHLHAKGCPSRQPWSASPMARTSRSSIGLISDCARIVAERKQTKAGSTLHPERALPRRRQEDHGLRISRAASAGNIPTPSSIPPGAAWA